MNKTKLTLCVVLAFVLAFSSLQMDARKKSRKIQTDREYWVEQMVRIVRPVYENLSQGTLRANMPVETTDGLNTGNSRKDVAHLEALGRSFCGIAPWLNLGPDDSPEGQLRAEMIDLVVRSIANAVDPASPDYMRFDGPGGQCPAAVFCI